MEPIFVFDIETIPDVAHGRQFLGLHDLDDDAVAKALFAKRRQAAHGSEFLPHYMHQIVAISVVFQHKEKLQVWSLGEADSTEADLIERFYAGIEKYNPVLVSWNGGGFDLPVLHYRAMVHGISAKRYWETGDLDPAFRYNNYLNRFHYRHLDLMDVIAGYQMRANAPLDQFASLLGFPGKMGMHGSQVWQHYQQGDIEGIRNYCETDVLNTYLVYLRFELMRGKLDEAAYQHACDDVKTLLQTSQKPHLTEFLEAWEKSA